MDGSRRQFLHLLVAIGGSCLLPCKAFALAGNPIQRPIPATKELLPVIGMGTWLTFDVGDDEDLRLQRQDVLKTFFDLGGSLVDSSPMYGSSEAVIGDCLRRLNYPASLFSATKVWTWSQSMGIDQMQHSQRLWGVKRFDLMQIHNMVDWETHLETLQQWKAEGKVRYIGITTSHGRRHEELEKVLQDENFDFVQFTYNIADREAEHRLLPLAAEKGLAVIINRPFQGGNLFSHTRNKPLPLWAKDYDITNWAQFFLKYIVSQPSVTCAIPATTKVAHIQENMGALYGALPEPKVRQAMVRYFEGL
jgi:diketogulonate reductase-like aldo/keto reductase